MGGNKPTLKTIAEISGLAVPTVSRALSGAQDIGQETRARVRQIADEIGYVPNRAGVRLRTGRTNVISLVLPADNDAMNHTARLVSAIAGGLRETNYHLIITPYFRDEDPLKPVRYIVETGSADAVILNQVEPEDARVAYLMERGFPFACHGRTRWASEHAYFDYDNEAWGRMAVETLVARGRRQILMGTPPLAQSYAQHMIDGARAAAAGIGFEILATTSSADLGDRIEAAVAARLAEGPAVDAIILPSSAMAMPAVSAAEMAGYEIGREIDVLAKEVVPMLSRFRAPILTHFEDISKAGTFLAQAAIHAATAPEAPPMQALDRPQG